MQLCGCEDGDRAVLLLDEKLEFGAPQDDPVDPAVSFLASALPFWAGIVLLVMAWRRRRAQRR